ncbi:hypothetical protein BT69DRAFT_1279757 [Atractiella rhizophila]|nr:hypothetical protein BT69DRAFT_1279757 [Atractiella rhizophila]
MYRITYDEKEKIYRIHIFATDGNESHWPSTQDGPFENITRPKQKTLEMWLKKLGDSVAKLLELDMTRKTYALAAFPPGYNLFTKTRRKSGDPTDPTKVRSDAYLYGRPNVIYRSPNEFVAHAYWLLQPLSASKVCECIYCGPKTGHREPQKVVNREVLGLKDPERKSGSKWGKIAARLRRDGKLLPVPDKSIVERSKTFQEGRTIPNLSKSLSKDREKDLRVAEGMFRELELVWVRLGERIGSENKSEDDAEELAITHWPAVVFKKTSKLRSSAGIWKSEYSVRLLAADNDVEVEEDSLLPWLAHPPNNKLFELELRTPKGIAAIWDEKQQKDVRTSINDIGDVYTAVTPYALALQTGAHIIRCFLMFDRYKLSRQDMISRSAATSEQKAQMDEALKFQYYQGMFWGAEKIWSGELVRLLAREEDLPLEFSAQIRPGSFKSFFLKIHCFFVGAESSARVAGELFGLRKITSSASTPSPVADISPAKGYFFQPLSPPGGQHIFDIEYLAGRYYIPSPSFTVEEIESSLPPTGIDGAAGQLSRVATLAGFHPGTSLFMKSSSWLQPRRQHVVEAEKKAQAEMLEYIRTPMEDNVQVDAVVDDTQVPVRSSIEGTFMVGGLIASAHASEQEVTLIRTP